MHGKAIRGRMPLAVGIVLFFSLTVHSQTASPPEDKSLRPSPPGQATFAFADGKTLTIDYGRPRIRDPETKAPRKIMGSVVPYGQVWRTGANEATMFGTTANLDIGGKSVPAGQYTIYSLPAENAWKLIVNRQTGQWGTEYDQKQDLARIDMRRESLPQAVDQFTISFRKTGPDSGILDLAWENTRASVSFRERK